MFLPISDEDSGYVICQLLDFCGLNSMFSFNLRVRKEVRVLMQMKT